MGSVSCQTAVGIDLQRVAARANPSNLTSNLCALGISGTLQLMLTRRTRVPRRLHIYYLSKNYKSQLSQQISIWAAPGCI
jgi:hypothetical protein